MAEKGAKVFEKQNGPDGLIKESATQAEKLAALQ